MLFSKRGKIKKEFDTQLVQQYLDTKEEWKKAQAIEGLSDDYDIYAVAERKLAESKYLFLLKEARIRRVKIR